jgi:hypothetical protein
MATLYIIKIARHLSGVTGNVSLGDFIKEEQIIEFNNLMM